MKTAIEVWGIAVMQPSQKPAVDAHCFGDCGKISMGGAINDEMTGGLFVCPERACPHEEKTLNDYGSTMSLGRKHAIHLRVLKQEPKL